MLKVRSFKPTGDHRPFWSKFDVKLGSWGIIHTGKHRPVEVSTKPLPLPPGSSAGFTPRARSASLMGWVGGWVGGLDGVSKVSFKFLYALWVYTVKTVEIRRQFKTRPGKSPDTLTVELRQFSCRSRNIRFLDIYPISSKNQKNSQKIMKKINF